MKRSFWLILGLLTVLLAVLVAAGLGGWYVYAGYGVAVGVTFTLLGRTRRPQQRRR